MNFKNYLKEIWLVCKEHCTLIASFVLISILLIYIKIPFVSILLMLILMFYLSKTKEYKDSSLIGKIFQFILFFIFLVIFLLVILVPTTIISIGVENLSAETISNSNIIKDVAKIGAYISMIFVFVPYRIFDAGENVFKSIKYSLLVVKNNFIIFLVVAVLLLIINYLTIDINSLDTCIYLLGVILTVTLYRLNVKK